MRSVQNLKEKKKLVLEASSATVLAAGKDLGKHSFDEKILLSSIRWKRNKSITRMDNARNGSRVSFRLTST